MVLKSRQAEKEAKRYKTIHTPLKNLQASKKLERLKIQEITYEIKKKKLFHNNKRNAAEAFGKKNTF
jgi:hypothetical protein